MRVMKLNSPEKHPLIVWWKVFSLFFEMLNSVMFAIFGNVSRVTTASTDGFAISGARILLSERNVVKLCRWFIPGKGRSIRAVEQELSFSSLPEQMMERTAVPYQEAEQWDQEYQQ